MLYPQICAFNPAGKLLSGSGWFRDSVQTKPRVNDSECLSLHGSSLETSSVLKGPSWRRMERVRARGWKGYWELLSCGQDMANAHVKPQQLWLPTGVLHKIKPARTQVQTGTQESLPAAWGAMMATGRGRVTFKDVPMQIWVALTLIIRYLKEESKPEGTGGGD